VTQVPLEGHGELCENQNSGGTQLLVLLNASMI